MSDRPHMPTRRPRRRRAQPGEAGSATVWGVAVLGALWAVVLALVVAGGARVARHRAQTAADLTALAVAAQAVPMGKEACRRGGTVAEANRARLIRCAVVGTIADVVVTTRINLPPLGTRTLTARARAAAENHPHPDPGRRKRHDADHPIVTGPARPIATGPARSTP